MSFLSQLLIHYHLTTTDLGARKAPGSFANLRSPKGNKDFENVVTRLKRAIANKEKSVIYGDYDVDGITSTAIMKMVLDDLGLNPGYFVPSRYHEGYGLTSSMVDVFHQKGYQLIITVDNGIKAYEAIDKAKEYNMDVVIIDHHDYDEDKLPSTPYIFHHRLSAFIDYDCSAASLSMFVAASLRGKYNSYDAILAGLAVFSDVMPLVFNNLELAKIMLASLKRGDYKALKSLLLSDEVSYDNINFNLISSLNAPGRVSKDRNATNNVVRLLDLRTDDNLKNKLAEDIKNLNANKKEIVKTMTFRNSFESEHSISSIANDYSGLSGLFANKILNEKKKNALIFTASDADDSLLVGSMRALEGYSLRSFMEKNKKYFVAYGGHERAAGLTIKNSDYLKIATLFATEMEGQAINLGKIEDDSIEITLDDLNEENYNIYESFFPFGEGFKAPTFKIVVPRADFVRSKNGKAAFIRTNKNGKISLFSSLELIDNELVESLSLFGQFRKNTFNGNTTYDLVVNRAEIFSVE